MSVLPAVVALLDSLVAAGSLMVGSSAVAGAVVLAGSAASARACPVSDVLLLSVASGASVDASVPLAAVAAGLSE